MPTLGGCGGMRVQAASEQRRAFTIWLRTGRRQRPGGEGAIEFKFNPWHDPANGQFTFAGRGQASAGRREAGDRAPPKSGSYENFRPGGAEKGFGGGGTQSSWDPPKGRPTGAFRRDGAARGFGGGGATVSWIPTSARGGEAEQGRRVATSHVAAAGTVRPQAEDSRRHVSRNGYDYEIDERGRTRQVSGTLVLAPPQPRSRRLQRSAGGTDRLPKDDGGHYIAPRFNGPTEAFNHFAQDSNVNRGRYRAIEDEWAREKRAGHRITVAIVPHFRALSQRPTTIDVVFYVDGVKRSVKLPNEREGGAHVR